MAQKTTWTLGESPPPAPAAPGVAWALADEPPKAPEGQQPDEPSMAGALLRKAADGISFNYADEAAAWIQSKLHGVSYEDALAWLQKVKEKDTEKAGWAGTAAELAGGLVAPGFGVAKGGAALATKLAQSGKAVSTGARALYYGGTGAGLGTLSAHGAQVGEKDVGDALGTGGTIGGLVGGFTPVIGAGVKSVAPYIRDYGGRVLEAAQGMRHKSLSPGAQLPISNNTQKVVAREMADQLQNTGIQNRFDYAAASARNGLPGAPDSFATTAGPRIQKNIVDNASELRLQGELTNPETDYVRRFIDRQLRVQNPDGTHSTQVDRLNDDVFESAGIQHGAQRDPVLVRQQYDQALTQAGNALDELRDEAGDVTMPGLRRLLRGEGARNIIKPALEAGSNKGTITRRQFRGINNDTYPMDFVLDVRDAASTASGPEGKMAADSFLRAFHDLEGGAEIQNAYAGIHRQHSAREAFDAGSKSFTGTPAEMAKRAADIEHHVTSAARNKHPWERRDVIRGAAHGVSDSIRKNAATPGKIASELLDTAEKRAVWNNNIGSPNNYGGRGTLTADAATERIGKIEDRVQLANALENALGKADVSSDDAVSAMLDAARTTQLTPVYGATLGAKYGARLVPQVRRNARVRMAVDPDLTFERGSRTFATRGPVSPVELALRELDNRHNWNYGAARHYRQALVDTLARLGISNISERKTTDGMER